jgi:hypothetical protein
MKKFAQFATTILCVLIGIGVTMAEPNISTEEASLILEPQPLAEGDVLKTLDIVSEQKTLGTENSFTVVDGRVTIGKPLVYKLTNPKPGLLKLHNEKSHFYFVEFRFTLHPSENKRRYQEMKFGIRLSNPKATGFELFPSKIETEEDVKKSFDVGFTIAIPESPQSSVGAKATRQVSFKQLTPVTTAFGDGESSFYWIYSKPHNADMIEPGSRVVAAVIQVPDGERSLSAIIQWDVKLNRRFLDEWRDVPVRVEPITVDIPLL